MQPSRLPPHVLAIVLTAMLLLFLAGLVAAKEASQGSHPIAPTAPFLHPQ
jgi:ABC-type lipoprotein release transport system permease subunit